MPFSFWSRLLPGRQPSTWETRQNSWLLTPAWPTSNCHGYLGYEPKEGRSFSLSIPLSVCVTLSFKLIFFFYEICKKEYRRHLKTVHGKYPPYVHPIFHELHKGPVLLLRYLHTDVPNFPGSEFCDAGGLWGGVLSKPCVVSHISTIWVHDFVVNQIQSKIKERMCRPTDRPPGHLHAMSDSSPGSSV